MAKKAGINFLQEAVDRYFVAKQRIAIQADLPGKVESIGLKVLIGNRKLLAPGIDQHDGFPVGRGAVITAKVIKRTPQRFRADRFYGIDQALKIS